MKINFVLAVVLVLVIIVGVYFFSSEQKNNNYADNLGRELGVGTDFVDEGIKDVELYDKVIKVSLGEDRTFSDSINFFNNGKERVFTLTKTDNMDFIYLENNFLNIGKDEFGAFDVVFNARDEGVYVGEFRISSEEESFDIPVVMLVKKGNLFDVALDVAPNSLRVGIGEEFFADIEYHNLRAVLDSALAKVEIYDLNGNVLFSKEEVVSVPRNGPLEKRESFVFPEYYEEVVLVVSIRQGESFSAAAEIVQAREEVLTSPAGKDYPVIVFFIIIGFLIVSVIVLSYFWNRRVLTEARDWRGQVNNLRKAKFSDAARTLRKLQRQKNVLETAFKEHYISRNSYNQGMKEINALMNKLRKRL